MTTKLLAAIAADPEGTEPHVVFGDWLQAQGDPRGELIAVQHAQARKPSAKLARAERALIAKHAATWFGPLAHAIAPGIHRHWGRPPFHVEWHLGWFRSARLGYHDIFDVTDGILEMLPRLLALPAARFLQALSFGQLDRDNPNYYATLIPAIVRAAPSLRHLRALHFGDFAQEEWQVQWTHVGKLGPVWKALPRLVELRVHGNDIGLGALDLAALRLLELRTENPTRPLLTALGKAQLPRLAQLRLDLRSNCVDHGPLRMLTDGRFRALRHLAIEWAAPSRKDLIDLATGKTLAKLTTLSLASCAITDTKAAVIAAHATRFAHLTSLDLDNNFLSKRGQRLVGALCPNVVLDHQQPPDPLFEWDS